MYPSLLQPNTTEAIASCGQTLLIPKVELRFRRWEGVPFSNTFGNKPLIDFGGRPVFAELCIYELLRLSGWQVRWVETYGAGAMTPNHFTQWADAGLAGQQHEPIQDPAAGKGCPGQRQHLRRLLGCSRLAGRGCFICRAEAL